MPKQEEFFIIDAHGFLHRNYHALPRLTSTKGEEVGALYGFVNWIIRFLKEKSPTHIAVCFDSKGPTFRHNIYPEYKANRPKTDEELIKQLAVAREVCTALGLKVIAQQGAEADDLMASCAKIATKENKETVIVTSDKDIYQIAGGLIKLWSGSARESYRGENACLTKFSVPCKFMTDYLSIVGDSSDNVPGIAGLGPKTTVELINNFGTLENILKAAEEGNEKIKSSVRTKILNGEESAKLSKNLVLLKDNLLDLKFDDFKILPPDIPSVKKYVERFEFKNLLAFLEEEQSTKPKNMQPSFMQGELFPDQTQEENTIIPINFMTLLKRAQGCYEIFIYAEDDYILLSLNENDFSFKPISEITKEELSEIFKIVEDKTVLKLGYDLKYALRVLGYTPQKNIFINSFDISLAKYCLDPSGEFSLAGALTLNLNTPVNPQAEPVQKFPTYAQKIWALKKYFEDTLSLKNQTKVFKEMETPLLTVLLSMEDTGIMVDIPWLKTLDILLSKEMEETQKEIDKMAGAQININSPKQLGLLLFEQMKLPSVRKTKTGYSTDEETLEGLKKIHPIAEQILKYREATKLKATYVDALMSLADPSSRRVHTNFNQTGTVTGRLSSFSPNLQNIPNRTEKGRLIRQAFCAPEGKVLLSVDYSQIDLRVLAHESDDETLINAFKSKDDIHTRTASEVFNIPIEEVTKEKRSWAKGINFGIIYGQGPMALSQALGITMSEAKDFIDSYFARYDTVKHWINKTAQEAKKAGFVKTLFGHIRYLPEFQSDSARMASFANRAAVNTVVQGGSSDIIKKAMIDIYQELPEDILMLLQIHDELIFEVPENKIKEVAAWVKDKMENAFTLRVPLLAEAKAGKNLNQMGSVI